jgi:hypothetical protein
MASQPPSPPPKGCDACSSLRKTYGACLRALTVSRWVGGLCSLLPVAYILIFMISNSVGSFPYAVYLTGPGYTMFAILFAGWILMAVCLWQRCPNLLSVTIFLFTCFGHWALVTFVIILGYVSSGLHNINIAANFSSYLTAALLPPILLLLFAADILRAQRSRMFDELSPPVEDKHVVEDPEDEKGVTEAPLAPPPVAPSSSPPTQMTITIKQG